MEAKQAQQIQSGAKDILHQSEWMFLGGAFLSFLLSIWLWFNGQRQEGLFVGIWVPSVIGLGVFFQNIRARHERDLQ